MKLAYLSFVDISIAILDSAARYPLCWIVGLGALAITLQVTYALGAVRGLGL